MVSNDIMPLLDGGRRARHDTSFVGVDGFDNAIRVFDEANRQGFVRRIIDSAN
jgi:hypothetical protein